MDALTRALVLERLTVGGLIALMPSLAMKVGGAPLGADTPTSRYWARLFGVRNAVLGVLIWDARDDRARLGRLATLNACTEIFDSVAALIPLVKRQGVDRSALAALPASVVTASALLVLRSKAS